MSERKKVRIGPLNSVGGVVTELTRIYREGRRGEMDLGDMNRLATVLRELRCALEASDIERRLEALEAIKANVRNGAT